MSERGERKRGGGEPKGEAPSQSISCLLLLYFSFSLLLLPPPPPPPPSSAFPSSSLPPSLPPAPFALDLVGALLARSYIPTTWCGVERSVPSSFPSLALLCLLRQSSQPPPSFPPSLPGSPSLSSSLRRSCFHLFSLPPSDPSRRHQQLAPSHSSLPLAWKKEEEGRKTTTTKERARLLWLNLNSNGGNDDDDDGEGGGSSGSSSSSSSKFVFAATTVPLSCFPLSPLSPSLLPF